MDITRELFLYVFLKLYEGFLELVYVAKISAYAIGILLIIVVLAIMVLRLIRYYRN